MPQTFTLFHTNKTRPQPSTNQLRFIFLSSATMDSNRSKRSSTYTNGGGDGGIIAPKSNTPSRRSSAIITSPMPLAQTPLTASVSNIISNYSPPVYASHDKMPKLPGAAIATNGNQQPEPTPVPPMAMVKHDPLPKGSAYASLLCYQSATPPSPPSSLCSPKHAQKVITSAQMADKLAALDADPVAVKKRTKLRHRFSDVGSWGRKKKERNPKYHSIHIESLEVLGEPVVEDEFFVSIRNHISLWVLVLARGDKGVSIGFSAAHPLTRITDEAHFGLLEQQRKIICCINDMLARATNILEQNTFLFQYWMMIFAGCAKSSSINAHFEYSADDKLTDIWVSLSVANSKYTICYKLCIHD